VLDVWSTNGHGLYENVDPSQPDYHLRGRFRSAADGSYDLWTVKPVSYPIPDDGPVGDLLAVTGRHNMRPAHFHLIASADGYQSIVTELYTDDDPYLGTDAVFGVKPSLRRPLQPDRQPRGSPSGRPKHAVLEPGARPHPHTRASIIYRIQHGASASRLRSRAQQTGHGRTDGKRYGRFRHG
jgi:Dioxygenase